MQKPLKDQIRDQALHVAAAFLILATAVFAYHHWWFTLAPGLLIGLVRETAQHNTFKVWTLGTDSYMDIGFFGLGGLLLYLVA